MTELIMQPATTAESHTLPQDKSATSPPIPPMSPTRDEEFYCQDVIFLVEDRLFKVPRRPFEQDSTVFSTMFTLPPVNRASGAEGASDDHPVRLEGVKAEEFRALLQAIFRPSYGTGSRAPLTNDQWTSILHLSTMWFFDEIRERAIRELSQLISKPASRVVLARQFQIPGWMEPALVALAQQDILSARDLEALGWDMTAKLIQVRENISFSGMCACGCNYCTIGHEGSSHNATAPHGRSGRPAVVSAGGVRKTTDFVQKIREVFGAELY